MSDQVLLTIIAVIVFLGFVAAIWVLWNQAIYESQLKRIAAAIAGVEVKVDEAHASTNSRMGQLLKATMDLADATGYKRAQDEQAEKESAGVVILKE